MKAKKPKTNEKLQPNKMVKAANSIVALLQPLDMESRLRVLRAAAILCDVKLDRSTGTAGSFTTN